VAEQTETTGARASKLPLLLLALCYVGQLFDSWRAPIAKLLPSLLPALDALRMVGARSYLSSAQSRIIRAVACRTLRLLIGQASELEPPASENQEQENLLLALVRFAFDSLTRVLRAYLSWHQANALLAAPATASTSDPVRPAARISSTPVFLT
jgi:hypothetical protein